MDLNINYDINDRMGRDALSTRGVEDMAARSLRLYRQFFLTYENIWQALPAKSASALLPASIWQTLSAKSGQSALIREPATPESKASRRLGIDGRTLIARLSFTHLAELIAIDDPHLQKTRMSLIGDHLETHVGIGSLQFSASLV